MKTKINKPLTLDKLTTKGRSSMNTQSNSPLRPIRARPEGLYLKVPKVDYMSPASSKVPKL
jgi:hypothetical protein